MISFIKVAVLFALVVFLFGAFGALIALILNEANYIAISILIACVLSGAIFIFADKIVITMCGAKPMDLILYRDYSTMVEEMSIKFRIPKPKLFITNDTQSNILSVGRDPWHSAIIITQSAFNLLSGEEILAILAHEMAHIKKYHSMLGSVSAVLASILLYPAYAKINHDSSIPESVFLKIMGIFMNPFIYLGVFVIWVGMGGNRELKADKKVISIMNTGTILASALTKIADSAISSPIYTNPVLNSLYIYDPLGGTGGNISGLFLTHPSLEKRIGILTKN